MLSTLTIVGIFTEIFAGGILVAGFFAFLKKFFLEKETKDLALSFLFLIFSLFLGLMLASQLLYNIGGQISTLITLQKLISISLIFGSLFVFIFIKEKFKVPHATPLIIIYAATCFYLSYRILKSFAELIYRPEVIEPVVNF